MSWNDFVQREAENAAEDAKASANGHDGRGGCLTVDAWLARDLPEPDFLMGEWASTTSRGLLVSDTGLGKTNFCLALAFAMALGQDFLHWRCRRSARVLYVDGEMSRRLVKVRLADAARRAGAVPQTLFVLSRDDLSDMPPLNTEAGQRFIDARIEALGGVDFVIFDNVQALLIGDMKDEEPWQETLPWIRDLTRRSIGQLWVHHTGHDVTRSYGTKTREWQIDTVILLEAAERDADIAFSLKFTKARERSPDNRDDFDPITITLSNDEWSVEGTPLPSKPPSPLGSKFYDALLDALAAPNAPVQMVKGVLRAIPLDNWKRECVRLGLLDPDDKPDRRRALFNKYRRELIERDQIACENDLVWCLK